MFHDWQFLGILLAGSGIAVWHAARIRGGSVESAAWEAPASLFTVWMGGGIDTPQSFWFFLVLPLLAAAAYAGSAGRDLKRHYSMQQAVRSSRRGYWNSKLLAVFLGGGICVIVPLLLDLFLAALKYPAVLPDHYIGIGPSAYCLGSAFLLDAPPWPIVFCISAGISCSAA